MDQHNLVYKGERRIIGGKQEDEKKNLTTRMKSVLGEVKYCCKQCDLIYTQ